MKVLFLSRQTDALELLEKAAKNNGLDVQTVDPGEIYIGDKDCCQGIFHDKKEIEEPDFCVIRDGTIDMFVKYTMTRMFKNTIFINSYEAIESCRHKYMTQVLLNEIGVVTPKTVLISKVEQLVGALEILGENYPKIIKTVTGSHGIGVIKADSEGSLKSIVQVLLKTYEELMIQEFLEHEEDYRILTIGDKAVASMKRGVPEKDFRSNLEHQTDREKSLGEYKPSEKEIELSLKVAKALNCEVSALDYAFGKDGEIIVFEVNTSPGLNGIQSVAKDVDIADMMIKHFLEVKKGKVSDKSIEVVISNDPPSTEIPAKSETMTTSIVLKRINNETPFLSKIDTGAGKSWLGASNVSVNGQVVTFSLGDTTYRVALQRIANIRFAGGTHIKEGVPIVLLDVEHNGKNVGKVEFIIAERKSKYPVLLGRNALEKLGATITFDTVATDDGEEIDGAEETETIDELK